ncbi:MAG: (2Fe-2S) ferredoxin domain-containing protein [Rhodospirillales bacterium]|nr:(2Fe-2S) ferredoxin domain-containing protein [Rhodospirillales bacterium]MDP6805304.1 (2Fe-2S) ferredoxin domain-containing protein [Rhodospirillales bacterium]
MHRSKASTEQRPRTLLICVNRRFGSDKPSCAARGSVEIADALEAGVRTRRIDIETERLRCFGQCPHGPNLRPAPGGSFFHRVAIEDVPSVLDTLEKTCGTRSETAAEKPVPPLHLLGS